jgi:hypothetical protein
MAANVGPSLHGSGGQPGSAHDSHFAAASAAIEKPIAAIGLKSGHARSRRHRDRLQHVTAAWIDAPHLALIAFPGAVPEFAIYPCQPGDETIRLDRARNRACFEIDLMNLARPVMSDPERSFGPGEA